MITGVLYKTEGILQHYDSVLLSKYIAIIWKSSADFPKLKTFFYYLEIFKVKHPEKMFSRYLLFAYYLLDFSPIKWSILNLCKTITLNITQKCSSWTGVVLQNTSGGLLLMVLQGKTFFMFLSHYTEWYVLKAVPQRNSTTRVFWKYAVSLLENTHAKI